MNHDGSVDTALALVDAAARLGADAVKFQTFRAGALTARRAPKAAYQSARIGESISQFDMIRKLELPLNSLAVLMERASAHGLAFLSTPFDEDSLSHLDSLGMARVKLSSGDLTNLPLLRAVGRTGRPFILSTGMATMGEVEEGLGGIASGAVAGGRSISPAAALRSADGWRHVETNGTLLHCTTEYPTPSEEVNLRAMDTLRAAFGLPVGYSDHTEGIAVAIAAAARGATIIEKHFTLDRTSSGPDHQASLEPTEFAELVRAIRVVEMALGSPRKFPTVSEVRNIPAARRSLVAARPIRAGEVFSPENVTAKRPGTGVSPMRYDEWMGKVATRDYEEDDAIG